MSQTYLINAIRSYLKKTVNFLEKQNAITKDPKIYKRRRGTVIVDTTEGILLVSGKEKRFFLLPGGGAQYYESRKQAALRELQEETNLKAASVTYLFSHIGAIYEYKGSLKRNHHKVFLVKSSGIPQPTNEVKYIEYYQPGDQTKISSSTQEIIEKYLLYKQRKESL
jgi:8-oxo-dGTP diphosphatase